MTYYFAQPGRYYAITSCKDIIIIPKFCNLSSSLGYIAIISTILSFLMSPPSLNKGVRLDDVHSRRENQPNVHNNNLEFKIEGRMVRFRIVFAIRLSEPAF